MTGFSVGLMSGTSLDGVDAALVGIEDREHVELLAFHIEPFTPSERASILSAIDGGTARDLALLHEQSGNVPAATGATGPLVLGRVTPR